MAAKTSGYEFQKEQDIYRARNYLSTMTFINYKESCTPMFIVVLFTVTRTWMQPMYPSTDEWIKMWCIYKYLYIHTMEY